MVRARITPELRARNGVERVIEWLLIGCSTIAVFTTIGIVASVAFEAFRFFAIISPIDFLFGTAWSPQMAIRADQVGSSGSFGAVPLFAGTALISFIAMVIAVPIGLFSAIYLAEYAHPKFRTWAKPLLEVLAGVPTVVYGFFAALTIGPALRGWGEAHWPRRRLGERARRRPRHGHHDHSVRVLAGRRHDQRGAAVVCATAPTRSAPRVQKPSSRWCCAPRCRASSAACCWRSRAPSAKP